MSPSLPALLASWESPPWATSSTLVDAGIQHSCARSVSGFLTALPDRGPITVDVRLSLVDGVDIIDSEVRVVRGAPEVDIDGQRFSLDGAADLADALTELVALSRGRS